MFKYKKNKIKLNKIKIAFNNYQINKIKVYMKLKNLL